MDDIWRYFNEVLIKGLYWDNIMYNITDPAMVLYENKLLGHPIIRQLRVTNESCSVVESFAREIKECFANYHPDVEDKATFGDEGMRFEWKSAKDLEMRNEVGLISTYTGGGFIMELPLDDVDQAHVLVNQLKTSRWIDRGTRVVIVDFSLFNGNVNLFCAVRLLLELPATGGVLPKALFIPMNLFRYQGGIGTVLMALEGCFVGFVLFFLVEELMEIIRVRIKYFFQFWNLMDMAIISLSIAAIILSYKRSRTATNRINAIIESNMTVAPLDDVVDAFNAYQNVTSIALFLAWIKVFKYISVNRTMSQLSATLSRSSKDIGGFAVMFCVFFFAYAQFGYLVFGTQIEDYSTFYGAVFALLRTILGDFDYMALQRANRILGPLFFTTFVFFVFFVLLNMFLAIINDSYVEVKAELAKKKDAATLLDWIRTKINRLMNKKARKGELEEPLNELVTYDEYKKELVRAGYKESTIMEAFTKLDIKGTDYVTDKAMGDIGDEMNNLLDRRQTINEDHRNYLVVNRRVDSLEAALGVSVGRLEAVMKKMAEVEEKKVHVKEQENKLLAQRLLTRRRSLKEE